MIVITNPARGTWGHDSAWRLTDSTRIGRVDGAGPAVFGDVRSIALDASGRVYVLDFYAQEIRVFDTDGSYVRTLGAPGPGPGEFRLAVGMLFDRTERLWVVNQHNQRYSLFDTAGVLLQEFPRRLGVEMLEWRGFIGSDGGLYDWLTYATPAGRNSAYARYDTLVGSFVDTVPSPAMPEGTPIAWGWAAPTPHGWWLGVASEYRLWELTRDLDTVRVVYRAHESMPQTREQRDSARQAYENVRRRARGNIDWELPRQQRIFDWIVVDDRDYVWVGLSPGPDDQGTTFDVFDPEGLYLGALLAPYRVERLPPPVIRGGRIAFLTKGDLDVPYVVTLEVEQGP